MGKLEVFSNGAASEPEFKSEPVSTLLLDDYERIEHTWDALPKGERRKREAQMITIASIEGPGGP